MKRKICLSFFFPVKSFVQEKRNFFLVHFLHFLDTSIGLYVCLCSCIIVRKYGFSDLIYNISLFFNTIIKFYNISLKISHYLKFNLIVRYLSNLIKARKYTKYITKRK